MSNVTFGARLVALMEQADLNQTQLAEKVGIDRSVLSRIMNDKRVPQSHEIGWLADALQLSVEALLDGVELPEPARRDVERAQELARRVLKAEQARDAAIVELEALKAAHAAELSAQDRVLLAVRAESGRALDAANARILETERGWRALSEGIAKERDDLAAKVAALETQVARNTALARLQDATISDLQSRLTQVKGGAGQAAIVGALLGLAGGAALGSSRR